MAIFTLIVFGVALACAVFMGGGVTSDFFWVTTAIGVASALHIVVHARDASVPRLSPAISALLAGIILLAALQVMPLPLGLVAALSPARAALVRDAAAITGEPVSYATLSLVPATSVGYLLQVGGLVLVFVVVRDLAMRFRMRGNAWAVAWPLVAVAAAQGLLGVLQVSSDGWDAGGARGSYANRNHFAGLLELALPFAVLQPLAIFWRHHEKRDLPAGRALAACGLFVMAAAILLGIMSSLSRMGFISTFAALFVSGSLAWTVRLSFDEDFPLVLRGWRRSAPATMVAAIVLIGFFTLSSDPLVARFAETPGTADLPADSRWQMWNESLPLVARFPLVGAGLGAFESAFMPVKAVGPTVTVDYAHNDYLQVLIELGVVGFLMVAGVLALALRTVARAVVQAPSQDDRLLGVACLAALTAILLHSFVDFNLYLPANALCIAWLAGIASQPSRQLVR